MGGEFSRKERKERIESGRAAMTPVQFGGYGIGIAGASGGHVVEPAPHRGDRLQPLDAVDQFLIRCRVLHDHRRSAVHRQNHGSARFLEVLHEIRGLVAQAGHGADVMQDVQGVVSLLACILARFGLCPSSTAGKAGHAQSIE